WPTPTRPQPRRWPADPPGGCRTDGTATVTAPVPPGRSGGRQAERPDQLPAAELVPPRCPGAAAPPGGKPAQLTPLAAGTPTGRTNCQQAASYHQVTRLRGSGRSRPSTVSRAGSQRTVTARPLRVLVGCSPPRRTVARSAVRSGVTDSVRTTESASSA